VNDSELSYAAKYHRETWMSDDQWQCAALVADLFGGFDHVCGTFKDSGFGVTISVHAHRLSTFDFDGLTKLVLLAHDRMIRVDLAGSSPGRVKMLLHKRHKRDGAMHERHPTIETALETHRRSWQAPTEPPTKASQPEAREHE